MRDGPGSVRGASPSREPLEHDRRSGAGPAPTDACATSPSCSGSRSSASARIVRVLVFVLVFVLVLLVLVSSCSCFVLVPEAPSRDEERGRRERNPAHATSLALDDMPPPVLNSAVRRGYPPHVRATGVSVPHRSNDNMISVKLPDGGVRELADGASSFDLAACNWTWTRQGCRGRQGERRSGRPDAPAGRRRRGAAAHQARSQTRSRCCVTRRRT